MQNLMLACVATTALLMAGCATNDVADEPITWAAEWFQCKSSFECIAVLDAYCKYTAVNSRYSLVYQDWARQQVASVDEIMPCARGADDDVLPQAAICRNGTCVQPGSRN